MPQKKSIKFEQPSPILLLFNKYLSFFVIFVVIFILVGGYVFLFVPKIDKIKLTREDNTASELKRANNEKILKRIKTLEDDYNKIKQSRQDSLDKLAKFIPDEPQVAELFVMVEKIAIDNGFYLNNITITTPEDDGTDKIKTASINIVVNYINESEDAVEIEDVDGDGALSIDDIVQQEEKKPKSAYQAFKEFLVSIENNLRLMDITTVNFGELAIDEDGNPADASNPFTFTLKTYFK